jgi:hypothetical protein
LTIISFPQYMHISSFIFIKINNHRIKEINNEENIGFLLLSNKRF